MYFFQNITILTLMVSKMYNVKSGLCAFKIKHRHKFKYEQINQVFLYFKRYTYYKKIQQKKRKNTDIYYSNNKLSTRSRDNLIFFVLHFFAEFAIVNLI